MVMMVVGGRVAHGPFPSAFRGKGSGYARLGGGGGAFVTFNPRRPFILPTSVD